MRSIASNFINTILVQIPTILLGVISGIFITRTLGPIGKGEFTFIFANVDLFILFLGLGVESGIVYFSSDQKIPRRDIAGIVSIIYAIAIVIFSAILFVDFILDKTVLFKNSLSVEIYLYMILYFVFVLITTYCGAFLRSVLQFKIINRIILVNSIANFSVFIIIYYLNKQNLIYFSVAEIILWSVILLGFNTFLWLYFYYKKVAVIPKFNGLNKKNIRDFVKYNLMGYIGILINFFNYKIDLWFIEYYSTSKQLGFYSTAVNTAQFLLLFSRTLSLILQPYLSNFSIKERLSNFIFYSKVNTLIIIISVIVLFPIGGWFITFLLGNEFSESVFSFRIMLIAMIFLCVNQMLYIFFATSNKNELNVVANLFGLIVCIILNIILTPMYGITGAAIASVICYASIFCVLYFYYMVKIKNRKANIFIFVNNPIHEFNNLSNHN